MSLQLARVIVILNSTWRVSLWSLNPHGAVFFILNLLKGPIPTYDSEIGDLSRYMMMVICLSYDGQFMIIWRISEYCLIIIRRLRAVDHHMIIWWFSFNYHYIMLIEYHMITNWLSSDNHLMIIWKNVCKGSDYHKKIMWTWLSYDDHLIFMWW